MRGQRQVRRTAGKVLAVAYAATVGGAATCPRHQARVSVLEGVAEVDTGEGTRGLRLLCLAGHGVAVAEATLVVAETEMTDECRLLGGMSRRAEKVGEDEAFRARGVRRGGVAGTIEPRSRVVLMFFCLPVYLRVVSSVVLESMCVLSS